MNINEQLAAQQKLQAALQQHQRGEVQQAEQVYRELLKGFPDMLETYQYLAVALMDQQMPDEAMKALDAGLEKWPESPHLLTAYVSVLSSLSRIDEALEYAQKTADLYPKEADAVSNLASLWMTKGEESKALELFERVVTLNPNMPIAYYNIGCLKYKEKRRDEAMVAFERAAELDPNMVAAHNNLGELYNESGRYTEAIEHLEKVMTLDKDNKLANTQLGMAYHITGSYDKALSHFLTAGESGGFDADLYALIGNVHRDMINKQLALEYYGKALAIVPDHEMAKKNHSLIEGEQLANWHLEMLADGARNQLYDKAIRAAVFEGATVLDIGTGSGLLAMMAVRAGAAKVIACEMVPTLADIAREVVKDNGFEDKITIINKKSTDLKMGEDLDEKVDIVVSEILDVGLLGEGVIPSVRDALANLAKPGAKLVPQGADIYVQLIETSYKHKLNPLKELEGFDLSAFGAYIAETTYSRVVFDFEPHRKLSMPVKALSFDFSNPGPRVLNNEAKTTAIKVPVTASGTCYGVAFWFELHLFDDIKASSGSDGELLHWGQAMRYFTEPLEVREGETISLTAYQSDMMISFDPTK